MKAVNPYASLGIAEAEIEKELDEQLRDTEAEADLEKALERGIVWAQRVCTPHVPDRWRVGRRTNRPSHKPPSPVTTRRDEDFLSPPTVAGPIIVRGLASCTAEEWSGYGENIFLGAPPWWGHSILFCPIEGGSSPSL